MTKEVLVRVSGVHMADGESDEVSVVTTGNYYRKNGKHYIIYEEQEEDGSGAVKNTIKVSDGELEMIKGGDIRAHMVFQKGRNCVSCYTTPMGQMMLGVTADRIDLSETEEEIRIELEYRMEVNYSGVSRCHVTIVVRPAGTEA